MSQPPVRLDELISYVKGQEGTLQQLIPDLRDLSVHSVAPTGEIWAMGLYGEGIYLHGLLTKIGVTPDFLHCGAYKSASEIFMRDGPSPEAEAMENWLFDPIHPRRLRKASAFFGDQKLENEGKADKAAGKLENTVGGLKNARCEANNANTSESQCMMIRRAVA